MPRRNRVDPFGNIVANPSYGLLMGNRGCLHDDEGTIVRSSARDAWITCLPRWPGVHRSLMAPGAYTELFFLDEATAMAAGHRPCGSCRQDALRAFKSAWQQAHELPHIPLAPMMDAALRAALSVPASIPPPEGGMIALARCAYLRWRGQWLPWSFDGYGNPVELDMQKAPTWITPAPMLAVLHAGYLPLVHLSASRGARGPVTDLSANSPGHVDACPHDDGQ